MSIFSRIHVRSWGLEGLNDIPAIPRAGVIDIGKMLLQLAKRSNETKEAKEGLSHTYTINGETATGQEFMYGKSKSLFSFGVSADDDDDSAADEEDSSFWDYAAKARSDLSKMLDEDGDGVLNLLDDESFHSTPDLPTKATKDAEEVDSPDDDASFGIFGDKEPDLTDLFLETVDQWAMSLTTHHDVYQRAEHLLPAFTASLTDPDEASRQLWPTIANYGLAYNLLILKKVDDSQIAALKDQFQTVWTTDLADLAGTGQLYVIDLSIFSTVEAQDVDGTPRFTPSTITLFSQDLRTKAFTPVAVRVSGYQDKDMQIYTRDNATASAWIYALQATKTSVAVYGIWLGHVYHWHIVTAAMQMTMLNNVSSRHAIHKFWGPQAQYLITFDTILFLLWTAVAPPTSITTSRMFFELTNTFAASRSFFDDDPPTTLKNLGLTEEDFTVDTPWDQYPIMGQFLEFWQATETYVNTFVDVTYKDDTAVAKDKDLQAWMTASGDKDKGNIDGLPQMDNKDALKRVLTSLVYRVTMHGASRLSPNANPGFTFVANFPPCLQNTAIPSPDSEFDTKELLTYLPKTGVIGGVVNFFYTFIFSSPYEPFIPLDGIEEDLFFPDGMQDARNQALVTYRNVVTDFTKMYYGDQDPELNQWPLNIET